MKKILALIMTVCLSIALASCGAATLSGEPAVYENANKSFSIELPTEDTEDEPSWIINEKSDGDILDMKDSADTVNVQVQAVSKAKVERIAPDLESYKTYTVENTFSSALAEADLKDSDVAVPEFITNSTASTYTAKKTEGIVVFMESDSCFYTYLIVAVKGGYDANKKLLDESILSLKEIAQIN